MKAVKHQKAILCKTVLYFPSKQPSLQFGYHFAASHEEYNREDPVQKQADAGNCILQFNFHNPLKKHKTSV